MPQVITDSQTGQNVEFPDTSSADEIQHAFSDLQNGTIREYKPNWYDKFIRGPLEKYGAPITDPLLSAEAFVKNAYETIRPITQYSPLNALGLIPKVSDVDKEVLQKKAPVASLAGGLAGFIPAAAAIEELTGMATVGAVSKIPALKNILEGAQKLAETNSLARGGMAAAKTGVTMGEYEALANPQQQKEKFGDVDWNDALKAVGKSSATWSAIAGVTGILSKPISQIYTVPEMATEFMKQSAATGLGMAAAMKLSGSSDRDAMLGAGMGMILHGLHFHGELENYRSATIDAVKDLHSRYLMSQLNIDPTVADKVASEHVSDMAGGVIADKLQTVSESKPKVRVFSDEDKQTLSELSDYVSSLEYQKLVPHPTDESKKIWLSGGFPDELRGKGYTQKGIIKVLQKAIDGKEITPAASNFIEKTLGWWRGMHEDAKNRPETQTQLNDMWDEEEGQHIPEESPLVMNEKLNAIEEDAKQQYLAAGLPADQAAGSAVIIRRMAESWGNYGNDVDEFYNKIRGGISRGDKPSDIALEQGDEKNLVAMHNLDANNLIHIDKIGGIAVPSLSIGKSEHPLEGFGDITLLGSKDLINPAKRTNAVFNADIYSPRYPTVEYSIDSKNFKEVVGNVKKEEIELGRKLISDIDTSDFKYKGIEALRQSPILKLKYLRSIGKDIEIPRQEVSGEFIKLNPKIEQFIDKYSLPTDLYENKEFLKEYENLRQVVMKDAEEKSIKSGNTKEDAAADAELYGDGWYEDGKPNYNIIRSIQDEIRSKENVGKPDYYKASDIIREEIAKHKEDFDNWIDKNYSKIIGKERLPDGEDKNYNRKYLPHTLDNVVRIMKRELQSGEGFNYGLGNLRASVAKRYRTIRDIQADRNKILSREEFDKVKEITDNEFDDILNEAYEKYEHKDRVGVGVGDAFINVLIDGIRSHNIEKELKEYGFGGMDVDRIKAFLDTIRNMPTEYFEAKIRRAVGLNEFSGAVIPKFTPQRAREVLDKNGIKYIEYDPNIEGDRARAVRELSQEKNLLFQGGIESPEFKKWFGDSKVVDKEGNPLVVSHGTKSTEPFTEFKIPKGEVGFHVGTKKQAEKRINNLKSEMFAGSPVYDKVGGVSDYYLKMENPLRLPDIGSWKAGELSRALDASKKFTIEETSPNNDSNEPYDQVKYATYLKNLIKSKGYDGIVYKNEFEGKGDSYIVFEPEQVKSVDNSGAFDSKNPNFFMQGGKEPRGWIDMSDPEHNKIVLGMKGDVSTAIHEPAHFYLNEFFGKIKSGDATDAMKTDWNTVKDWLKVKDDQTDLTVGQQETFARGFERYMREGGAFRPGNELGEQHPELRGVFENFRKWLTDIYKSVKELRVQLSPEVRNFYDKMLAIDKDPVNKVLKDPSATKDLISNMAKQVAGVEPTQEEKVKGAVSEEPKSIKQVAEETKILEPNVRRILGVGAKQGTFTRVDKGVYVLNHNGKDLAYIHTGDAIEILPKLVKDGFKADMVFLDPPYDAAGNKGGNRMNVGKGTMYNLVSPEKFSKALESIKKILPDENSPVIFMFSQSKSSANDIEKYTSKFLDNGFQPVAKGNYQKTYKDGKPVAFGQYVMEPEGILVFSQSGKLDKELGNLDFTFVRPKGYKTEKPAELLNALITKTTDEGDTILDPFTGSGVSIAEAIKTGRIGTGIEIDPKVVENIIKPRIEEAAKSTEESRLTPSGNIRPEMQAPLKTELFQEKGELFKDSQTATEGQKGKAPEGTSKSSQEGNPAPEEKQPKTNTTAATEQPSTSKTSEKVPSSETKIEKPKGKVKKILSSFSPIDEETPTTSKVLKQEEENKFVKNNPLGIFAKKTYKMTGDEIRKLFTGDMDEQIVRVNQWAQSGKKAVKNPTEQEGMFWYAGAEGDVNKIKDFMFKMENLTEDDLPEHVKDKEEALAKIQSYYEEIKPQLEAALKLSPEAIKQVEEGSQYYDEAGAVAKELGTIREVRDNYQTNRIYRPEKPEEFTKTGARKVTTYTSKSKARVYDTPFDAVIGGKEFATTNYFDALTMHNEELAYVNTSRKMLNEMSENDLGKWGRRGNMPDGWKQVGTLEKSVPIKDKSGEAVIGEDGNQVYSNSIFMAPAKLAEALQAITDPNNLRKVQEFNALGKFNGFVKSFNVALSFFHHFQFVKQTLSSKNGEKILADFATNIAKGVDPFESPDFKENEQYFASVGLRTAARQANYDIMADLNKAEGEWIDRINKIPGVKQTEKLVDANNRFLFDYMQRYFKVMTMGERVAEWNAKNPDATDAEITEAHRGIARAINNTYGGLNWEMLGVTKSQQAILRLGFFAPDWLLSAIIHTKDAGMDWKTPAGRIARANLVKGLLVGTMFTQLFNQLTMGTWTDKNKVGHKLEWQLSPGVYVNFFGGATGELVKFVSNVIETGGIQGALRYFQGKTAPLVRFGLMLASGKNYSGQDIYKSPLKGDNALITSINGILNLASTVAPSPFAVQSGMQYATSGDVTPAGAAAVASGLGRYSTPPTESREENDKVKEIRKAAESGDMEAIDKAVDSGDLSENQANRIRNELEKPKIVRDNDHLPIDKLIDKMDSMSPEDIESLRDTLESKIERMYSNETKSPKFIDKIEKKLQKFYKRHNL